VKFDFKPLTEKDYFFATLLSVSIVIYGAMLTFILLGSNELPTAIDSFFLVVIGGVIFFYSMIKGRNLNNENI